MDVIGLNDGELFMVGFMFMVSVMSGWWPKLGEKIAVMFVRDEDGS